MRRYIVAAFLSLVLAGCGSVATATPDAEATKAAMFAEFAATITAQAPIASAPTQGVTPSPTEAATIVPPATVALAPSATPEPTASATPESTATVSALYSLSVTGIQDPATPSQLYTPQEGKKLVAVEVVLSNDAAVDSLGVNPLGVIAVDGDGYTYRAELGSYLPQLELMELGTGEKVKGWVGFVVPEGATIVRVKFEATYGEPPLMADVP